jgi:mannose-1-phosphate guanylyltransferase
MNIVILCGGSGTRLWPLSRTLYPKQFLKLFDNQSLFQKTILRNQKLAERFTIIVNQEQYFMALDQMEEINISSDKVKYILEPEGRNTAPAIALAALAANPNEVLFIVPSDHLIHLQDKYELAATKAKEFANNNKLVTFGIKPSYPETGYGYIESNGNEVVSFKEKPSLETAIELIAKGNFFWNSGMFCFQAKTYLSELKNLRKDIFDACCTAFEDNSNSLIRIKLELMRAIPQESIDYAVMEKSKNVSVVTCDIGWNDLGSFDSLYDVLKKDENGNTQSPDTIHINSKNNLVIGNKKVISTIDVENLIIIDTPDALLISNRGSTQKVKEVVQKLKTIKPELTNIHTTAHRPWGTYTVLEDTDKFKVKSINVRPGAKLSLQKHAKRSEHWVVVQGRAQVTVGKNVSILERNQSTYIPVQEIHRLENIGKEELILIEAQVGDYLGEDDIERIQDDYKRV